MPRRIVIDAGPLLALFDRDDGYHDQAIEFIKGYAGELITNLAVVTEVAYLLDFSVQAQSDFVRWVGSGALSVMGMGNADWARVADLLVKYRDLPMSFTDASLVATCERLEIKEVATVDRDFDIYRYRGRTGFQNVFLKKTSL